jgi:hypothetical protein
MPYKSSKQRAWMHINKPKIAKKWDNKYGGKIDKGFYSHMTHESLQAQEDSVCVRGDGFHDSSVPKKPTTDKFYEIS